MNRTASDGQTYDYFGYSVAISGDYLAVGSYLDDGNVSSSGSAFIFYRNEGGSDNWGQQAKLTADDAAGSDYFGISVVMSGDYVIVGAQYNDDDGTSSGSAYIFVRSGTNWTQQTKLTASDAAANHFFGHSVAIDGDYVIVGSPDDNSVASDAGSAYIFVRSGTSWTQQAKLTASDGAASDFFGKSVSIRGDYAVVGSYRDDDKGSSSGSAYIFVRSGSNWTQQAKLTASDGASSDFFGTSVSISGDYLVVGADGDDDNGGASGSAYIFLRSGSSWGELTKITASDGASSDYFGASVSISDTFVAVGAYGDDDKGSTSGSVYIFKREGTSWTQHNKFLASDGAASDRFGWSVSLDSTTLSIGAPYDNTQTGSVYIYPRLPPAAPTNLAATPGSHQVTLTWTPNTESDFQRYRIYGGTSANPTTKVDSTTGGVNDTTKILTDLTNETIHYYRITAVATDGRESSYSNEVSVIPSLFSDLSAGLTEVYRATAAWGDYDSDGDLDILLTGYTGSQGISKVYGNANGTFSDISAGLEGVYYSSAAWGDYDNDGDLDVLLSGSGSSGYISRVYQNTNGTFTDVSANLIGVREGSVAWGDYDNDGDLDIALSGYTGVWPDYQISKIYRNDGGSFTDISAGLTGVRYSSVAWGDYDNDGDLDLLLTGYTGSAAVTELYKNSDGTFTDIQSTVLQGVYYSSVDWGDYDSDGDLDILLAGYTGSGRVSKVYRNNDGANFTDIAANLDATSLSSVKWGDYDNDGDLDVLQTGYLGGSGTSVHVSRVYRNDTGSFVDINAGLTLSGASYGSGEWGDYDGDGDLDILLVGDTGAGSIYVSNIYRNDITTANAAPTAPTGLSSSVSGDTVTLSWSKSTDDLTAQNALTYNLRVGSSTGGIDLVSPMANVATSGDTAGQRRLPDLGNVNHNTSWSINGLTDGTYFWSVQAIDNGFMGSPFSTEASFTADVPPSTPTGLTAASGDQEITLSWDHNPEADLQRYRIFRDTSSPATTFIDSVVATSPPDSFYVDQGLTDGQTYYYRITAVDNGGHESGYSGEVSAVPGLKVAELLVDSTGSPSPGGSSSGRGYPLNTYYHDVKHQSLYLAQDLVQAGVPAGATVFGVEIKPSQLPGRDLNDFRVATAFTEQTTLDSFLTTSVVYGPDTLAVEDFEVDAWEHFSITAIDWDAADNLVVEFSHDNSAYSSNGGVYLRQAGSNRGRRGYSDSGAGNYPFNESLAATTDDKVVDLQLVYVNPAVLAPSHITATPGHQQIILTWHHSGSSNLSHYVISRGTDPSTLAVLDSVASTDSTFTDAGLTNGITYYYRVKSRTTSGEYSALSEFASATPAYVGPVWWVATDGDNANQGMEESPFADLSTAMASVSQGDTIKLKPGTYTGEGNRGVNPAGLIASNLVIMSTHGADTTFLDAESLDRHFIFESGEDSTFEIVGMTFQNGLKTDGDGGSVHINASGDVPSSPTFKECVFRDNAVSGWWEGGAVAIINSSPKFVRCQFKYNLTESNGGAIMSAGDNSDPTFSGCTFIHNAAANDALDYRTTYGGAVYIGDGHATFTQCDFDSNRVQSGDYAGYGGAVFIGAFNNLEPGKPVTFSRCSFRGNSSSPNDYAYGGAVYAQSRARFVNCLFAGNAATGGADYGYGYGGAVNIDVSSQYNSSTFQYEYGEVTLINCTLTKNVASYVTSGYEGWGGAIYLSSSVQNLILFNSIIWGNSADQNPSVEDNGASPVTGYNDMEHGDSYSWFNAENSLVTDPAFTGPETGDYSLTEASFCLGAGTASFEGLDAPSDDILGNARPDPEGSDPDLGAYESPLGESDYPAPVTGLSALPTSGQVTLSWNANPEGDIDYYLIYMSLTQGFTPAPEDSLDISTDTTYQATGLTDGVTYYFRVAAVDTQGFHGAPSAEVSSTPSYAGPVWWVATDGASGNVGSESSPFESIQTALDAAGSGDTILVKEGLYGGSSNRDMNIDRSVVIMSLSGPDVTVIDAESQGRHFLIDGVSRDVSIAISGFTFINGWDSWSGGSMNIEWSFSDENGPAPVITNCIFLGNSAGTEGGAVRIYDAAPTFVGCEFRDNTAAGSIGGAVFIDGIYASPEFLACKISHNGISTADWSMGGAIHIGTGTATFEDCVIDSNYVDVSNSDNWAEGGAVYISGVDYWYYEPVTFLGCTFRDNRAESDGRAEGGGLAIHGRADLVNCVLSGNEAVGGRTNPSAIGTAGAILADLGEQYNPQTTFYEYGAVNIVNCTITGNVARDETGNNQSAVGGVNLGTDDFFTALFNTILWDNTSDGNPLGNNLSVESLTNKSIDFNDVEGSAGVSWVGDNSLDAPPLFSDPDNGDYSLSPFSPVMEAGTTSFGGINAPSMDILGADRPVPAGTNPDMGAFEGGAVIIVSLPQEVTIVPQDTTFDILFTAMDSQGNPVDEGTTVAWTLIPSTAYVTIVSEDTITTGGEAGVVVAVAADAPRGLEFRVGATLASVRTVISGSYFVLEKVVRAPPPPAGLVINPDDWTQVNSFTLTWTNPSWYYNISGVAYRISGEDPVRIAGDNISQIENIQLPDNGEYPITVWLMDELANESEDSSAQVVARWDNVPPGDFTVTAPGTGWTNETYVRFEWSRSEDATSGLDRYELQVGTNAYTVEPDSTGLTLPDSLDETDYGTVLSAYDLAGNSTAASNAPYVQIDRSPVSLSHTPVVSAMLSTDTDDITVSFFDDRSGIDRVEMFYRRGGLTSWTGPLDMEAMPSRSIPGSEVTTAGLEYYIEAEDVAGNFSRVPESGGFYSIIVTIPGNGQLSTERWPGGIPSGQTVASYNLLSFPILPDANSPSDILTDDLGPYDATKWRFFTYGGGGYIEFPRISRIETGKAYFLISAGSVTLDTDQGTTVSTSDPFEIDLEAGNWNFIGNPFDFQINLENITADDGTSIQGDPNVFTWEGEWRVPGNLRPWFGFIYKSTEAARLYIDPRGGGQAVARSMPVEDPEYPLLRSGPESEWQVKIDAQNGNARDGVNQIGVHREALDGYDRLDAFEPPFLPGGISLRIPHPDWGEHADMYTTDFRSPSTEGHFWDLEVMAGDAHSPARVKIEGIERIPEDFDVFLVDRSLETALNLRWKSTYVFDVPSANSVHHLRLVAGTREFVEDNSAGVDLYPDAYQVSQNFPNPFNAQTTIILSLKDRAVVDLSVYNLLGQEVARLIDHDLRPSGYYNVIWDGRNASGRAVSSGIYVFATRMSSPTGKVLLRQTRKMMLVK
ncbi:MAG: FG-GAP-like repeat-containing protein [Fidelibacterota bacterium]